MDSCRICGNSEGNREFRPREMMFGLRDEFAYFQCAACGCLQIRDFPPDMARFYPANYYSMEAKLPFPKGFPLDSLRRWESLFRLRVHNFGNTKRRQIFDWLRGAGVDFDSNILDVGCGRGKLLHQLRLDGFRRLTGLDPFVAGELRYANGITVHKHTLAEHQGAYDLIMMHHSFEHMPGQLGMLRDAARLLAPGGTLLLRIPVVSVTWREYGIDWLQLDAPRHFFLHSPKSLSLLAAQAGLAVDRTVYDSKGSQFWGSEQYRRGIPHRDPRSYGENPKASVFSPREIRAFERRARELNARGEGDTACFYLRAVGGGSEKNGTGG